MELAPIAEPQLILYKDTTKAHNHQTQTHFFAQRTANYATPSVRTHDGIGGMAVRTQIAAASCGKTKKVDKKFVIMKKNFNFAVLS